MLHSIHANCSNKMNVADKLGQTTIQNKTKQKKRGNKYDMLESNFN